MIVEAQHLYPRVGAVQMCIGGMAEGQRKPCSVVELVAEFHLTAELHHVPEILAAAFDPEARGEAAGQHHPVEEGDVDQHADAAPDAEIGRESCGERGCTYG